MTKYEIISSLSKLFYDNTGDIDLYYETLEKCNLLVKNYHDYLQTSPIDCDKELSRLKSADFDTSCALLTTLLREDHFINGSFEKRYTAGQVKPVVERMLFLLGAQEKETVKQFSEKALDALGGYYVYALIDPRTNEVFYIGKGINNRIFAHDIESEKDTNGEKEKVKKIREIKKAGYEVKRVIVNFGMSEDEAFLCEASLINLMSFISKNSLTNIVSGHHIHNALTVEDFEMIYGAEHLQRDDIRHGIMVIKINKLYRRDMSEKELYDAVRGLWRASMNTIKQKNIKYVFGVYNQLIVAVYKPDKWCFAYEKDNAPRPEELDEATLEKHGKRVYFICDDYKNLDDDGKFYLHKSIADLKINQTAQNPITYILPIDN